MQAEIPESFQQLCARAQKENDFETVAELVDRILQLVNENSNSQFGRGNRRAVDL